jgi:diacylglycerol O-acyltransferase / wax synthase
MTVLISRGGYITITARYDRASITDPDLFARCLLAGFDEVLALGGPGRATAASFSAEAVGFETSSPNGSAAQ